LFRSVHRANRGNAVHAGPLCPTLLRFFERAYASCCCRSLAAAASSSTMQSLFISRQESLRDGHPCLTFAASKPTPFMSLRTASARNYRLENNVGLDAGAVLPDKLIPQHGLVRSRDPRCDRGHAGLIRRYPLSSPRQHPLGIPLQGAFGRAAQPAQSRSEMAKPFGSGHSARRRLNPRYFLVQKRL